MRRAPSFAALALGLIAIAAAVLRFVPTGVPRFGGPFAMHEPGGRIVSDVSLRGRPFVVFFGFTRCGTVCPITLTRLTRLRRALGPAGEALEVLFVSVDPADTPADVARYLQSWPLPVTGLSGDAAARAQMMSAYRVFASGSEPASAHTGTVFLVGPNGEPRETIAYTESDASALEKLRTLVRRDELR